jgi:hypothetical protein
MVAPGHARRITISANQGWHLPQWRSTPDKVKALGRKIEGLDEALWAQARYALVVEGNRAKFSQNAALGDFLRATEDQVLVEASPVDFVWGIGLAKDHVDAHNPAQWRGLNLLGFALMEVRDAM